MSHRIAALVVMGIAVGLGSANGQETSAEPAFVEVTYMPVGAAYFASKDDAPSFGLRSVCRATRPSLPAMWAAV